MLLLAMRTIPRAASTRVTPSLAATPSSARFTASMSATTVPPQNQSLSMRPRSRLASVVVASVPPRPYPAGPGTAPTERGPTWSFPKSSTVAIDPPPLPISTRSTTGTMIW